MKTFTYADFPFFYLIRPSPNYYSIYLWLWKFNVFA